MKKQKNLSIKVRDLEPLKDVTGGRKRALSVRLRLRQHRDPRGGYGIHLVQ